MFDFVRNNQKLMQFILLLFIAPAFVLVGVDGYGRMTQENGLAKVGDRTITQEEFDAIKRERLEALRQQSGDQFDPKKFDTPDVNNQLLESIVADYLIQGAVQNEYLTASDEAVRKEIMANPLFQENGQFSKEVYNRELSLRGISGAQFDANIRFNLARNQVLDPILSTAFLSKKLQAQLDDVQLAGRMVRVKTVDLSGYMAKVQVTDSDIQKYYQDQQALFMDPQKADVEYVVLSSDALKSTIALSDDEVAKYYEQNKQRFTTPEERKARHILLPAKKEGTSDADLKAAAEKVLVELKSNPTQFAELAKKYSTDPGSASSGGDLGYFGKGMMVPEFDQAVFTQKKGEIGGLVQSQFGYHIIEVLDTRGGETKPLEAVKANIVDEIRAQKMTTLFASAQGRFSEMVYEGGQSFAKVESELKVKANQYKGLTANSADAPEVLKDKKVIEAIFSEESIKNRNNTKAVQVGGNLVSARILDFVPATARPLDQVKAQIAEVLKREKAAQLAEEDANGIVKALNDSKPEDRKFDGFSEAKLVSALNAKGVPPGVAQTILESKVAEFPKAKSVTMPGQGVVVLWLDSVASTEDVRRTADPQVVKYYESLTEQAWQESLAVASRKAMSKRIGVEYTKKFQ